VGKKSTNAEINLRVTEVYGLLTRGYSRSQILQHTSEVWGVSDRMGDHYIAKARELIDADCNLSRPAFLAECLAGIRTIRQKAEADKQHQTALNAIKLQAELTGLTS
jgi:hypothetical protein